MSRRTLSWSLERSRIQADRKAPVALTFAWRPEVNSFGDTLWMGYDAEGRHQGSVALFDGKFVARAFLPGTLDQVRLGEWPAKSGCVNLRKAQTAVEAFVTARALAAEAA